MDTVDFQTLLDELQVGDLRTVGQVQLVVAATQHNPDRFSRLLETAKSEHPGQSLRAANAAEQVSREFPELLNGNEETLLWMLESRSRPEVAWHAAQMLERVHLSPPHASRAIVAARHHYGNSKSRILQTFAMQLLWTLMLPDEAAVLLTAAESHSAASVRARARLLGKSRPKPQ